MQLQMAFCKTHGNQSRMQLYQLPSFCSILAFRDQLVHIILSLKAKSNILHAAFEIYDQSCHIDEEITKD